MISLKKSAHPLRFLLPLFWICIWNLFSAGKAEAQTPISGVINIYTPITATNLGSNFVTVSSTAGFAVGDTVLLIQMKGATMDLTNTAAFGNITAINNAGKYEFAIICDISGNNITFDQQIINNYSGTGSSQMVSVPNYTDANITGTLTANDWNGTTGGVLVFWVSGTLSFAANIDISNMGFRGGASQEIVYNCNCSSSTSNTAYFYPAAATTQGSFKGEGIANLTVGYESGRGKHVNGGGGGNDHNAGGGGGSNYGTGGIGSRTNNCVSLGACRGQSPGIGGASLNSYYTGAESRIFMGGGGGAGNYADNAAQPACAGANTCPYGGDGGGIAIIHAGTIDGNGYSILSRGQTITSVGQSNGVGGGGAGGVVLLDVAAYTADALTVNVGGGNGGNHSWFTTNANCKGPGGGGGGGVVWHAGGALPGNVTTVVTGGARGAQTGAGCAGGAYDDAVAGAAGSVVANLTATFSSTDYASCNLGPLPAYFSTFTGYQLSNTIRIDWQVSEDLHAVYFELFRSASGQHFELIGTVGANAGAHGNYSFTDQSPFTGSQFYQLRAVDDNGSIIPTEVIEVMFAPQQQLLGSVYPNPAPSGESLFVQLLLAPDARVDYAVSDAAGRELRTGSSTLVAGETKLSIPIEGLTAGMYYVSVRVSGLREYSRFLVK